MSIAKGRVAMILLAGASSLGISLCSNPDELTCLVQGDNLRGRVTFGPGQTINAGEDIVVEYATPSFGSAASTAVTINAQGLITVPYTLCVPRGSDFQVRAYQDSNSNRSPDAGEVSGRKDGTSNGHATYITGNVPNVSGEWRQEEDFNLVLDSTSAP